MTRMRGKNGKGRNGIEGAGGPRQGSSASASSILKLQKTAGNTAVARLMRSGAGLDVNPPGDVHEQEAERMAERATSPVSAADGLLEGAPEAAPVAGTESPLAELGPGRPLDPEAQSLLEPRFGRDFGAVRVHDDPAAAEAADAVEARAFTVGRDVVFARGQYTPDTTGGKRLLAHELTHVVQQSAAGSPPLLQRSPWDVKPPKEQPAPAPSLVFQIGTAELISSEDPRLAEFAKEIQNALPLSPGGIVQITGFWERGNADGTGGVDLMTAKQRAELAKNALEKLGIAPDRMSTSTLASHVLSDPRRSPGGLVRIALLPTGAQQPAGPGPVETVPPPPRLPGGMFQPAPRLKPFEPLNLPSTPQAQQKPPGPFDEEPKAREGKLGDLLKVPLIKNAVDQAKEQATETWKGLPLGGKVALITGAIGLGLGIASNPALRDKGLEQLNGKEIPIPLPGVPGKFLIRIFTKEELPKLDPHNLPSPKKLTEPLGQGLMLKWEVRF